MTHAPKRWLYAIAPPQFSPLEEPNVLSAMAIAIGRAYPMEVSSGRRTATRASLSAT